MQKSLQKKLLCPKVGLRPAHQPFRLTSSLGWKYWMFFGKIHKIGTLRNQIFEFEMSNFVIKLIEQIIVSLEIDNLLSYSYD